MTSINFDNKNGKIYTDTDNIVKIAEKGSLQLSDGEYMIEESDVMLSDFVGSMRYNKERKCLQVFDGMVWKEVDGEYEQTSHIIWSLIF